MSAFGTDCSDYDSYHYDDNKEYKDDDDDYHSPHQCRGHLSYKFVRASSYRQHRYAHS